MKGLGCCGGNGNGDGRAGGGTAVGVRPGLGQECGNRQQPKTRHPGFPTSAILTGETTMTKRRTTTTAPGSTSILLPPPPPFPLPSCDCRSRGCIPLPTTTRMVTARNRNAILLLVARVLNSATTMWTTVRTRILRRRTGGGGYHDGNKSPIY